MEWRLIIAEATPSTKKCPDVSLMSRSALAGFLEAWDERNRAIVRFEESLTVRSSDFNSSASGSNPFSIESQLVTSGSFSLPVDNCEIKDLSPRPLDRRQLSNHLVEVDFGIREIHIANHLGPRYFCQICKMDGDAWFLLINIERRPLGTFLRKQQTTNLHREFFVSSTKLIDVWLLDGYSPGNSSSVVGREWVDLWMDTAVRCKVDKEAFDKRAAGFLPTAFVPDHLDYRMLMSVQPFLHEARLTSGGLRVCDAQLVARLGDRVRFPHRHFKPNLPL